MNKKINFQTQNSSEIKRYIKTTNDLIDNFLDYSFNQRNFSEHTISNYKRDLEKYLEHTISEGIDLFVADRKDIRNFIISEANQGYKNTSLSRKLSSIKSFYKFLLKRGIIKSNPSKLVNSPKKEKKLPSFMYFEEIEKLLVNPEKDENIFEQIYSRSFKNNKPLFNLLQTRDRLIFYFLYSTGVRVSELVSFNLHQINFQQGTSKVMGKGKKERSIFFTENVLSLIKKYLTIRKSFTNPEETALFINQKGTRLTQRSVQNIVKNAIEQISLKKKVTPHTFRHTFATHLMDNGADIRSVGEMLGHASISTTQIYSHVTKDKIKKVYDNFHPHA